MSSNSASIDSGTNPVSAGTGLSSGAVAGCGGVAPVVRSDGRARDDLRLVRFTKDYQEFPLASVLVETGRTRVAVGVWLEEATRSWLTGSGRGWVTAEYGMLPGATQSRFARESATGKVNGRSQEIQRLIGRSLRMAVDLKKMKEKNLRVDCDVIQADGGTRTASITGGYVALEMACKRLMEKGILSENPIIAPVAATSCGILPGGQVVLDLDYSEDSTAEADINFVFRAGANGPELVEIQGTAEERPFGPAALIEAVTLAQGGCARLFQMQQALLASP